MSNDKKYYITSAKSQTGQNLQVIANKVEEIRKIIARIGGELGFTQWREHNLYAFGGIAGVGLKNPDLKLWKRVEDGFYMPRLNSKKGKHLRDILSDIPVVSHAELNSTIGFKKAPLLSSIGYRKGKNKFGICVFANWKVNMPENCKEVTFTEYEKL